MFNCGKQLVKRVHNPDIFVIAINTNTELDMRVITLGFALLILSCSLFAQLEVTLVGTDHAIDFDSQINGVTGPNAFDGTGFVPNPTAGQLDSDAWSINGLNDGDMTYGGSYTTGDYARGDASTPVTSAGVYFAELSPSDRALVIQPSGSDLTPGTIELRCLNQTGQFINSISLSYEIHVRNDQDRSTDFHAGIRTERMGDYTDISDGKILASQLEYTSDAANSGPNFVQVDRDHTFTGMIIDPGEFFYIVWETDDNSGSGSRDELALDDIVINVQGVDSLILYSQNSGEQTTSVLSSTQQWSSRPSGNVQFLMYPLEEEADYQIQSGDTMIIGSNSAAIEMKDLIVQSGAQVLGESDGIASTNQRYIDVFGDVICD
ncbi:MAG: hypothetical protein HKN45_01055, partial [Flavobacteriales bacterium]|nr:hypothetical protein [Flavobacteriales bacterium]